MFCFKNNVRDSKAIERQTGPDASRTGAYDNDICILNHSSIEQGWHLPVKHPQDKRRTVVDTARMNLACFLLPLAGIDHRKPRIALNLLRYSSQ